MNDFSKGCILCADWGNKHATVIFFTAVWAKSGVRIMPVEDDHSRFFCCCHFIQTIS